MNELLEIVGKSYVLYAMVGIFCVGIASRFFLNMIYRNLQSDVYSLPTPKRRILKQIKLKYESCNKLDMQINNTVAFVRKNLCEYKICGISLRAIEKILGQAIFFCMLIGVTAVVFAARMELESRVIIVHIATTVLVVSLLYNYDRLSDIAYKKQVIEIGIVDFLENHFRAHLLTQERTETGEDESLEAAEKDRESKIINFAGSSKRMEEEREPLEEEALELRIKSERQPGEAVNEKEETVDDNKIIEEVLKEFFG